MDIEAAKSLAEKAVNFDKNGKFDAAIYFYSEAATGILELIATRQLNEDCRAEAERYVERAEELKRLQCDLRGSSKSTQQMAVERAEFLLYQALDEDADGNADEAVQLYTQAIELCLQSQKATQSEPLQRKLKTLAQKALDRAEELKEAARAPPPPPSVALGGLRLDGGAATSPSAPRRSAAGKDAYSKEELTVLRCGAVALGRLEAAASFSKTSVINGREYVPFMAVDLKERFAYPIAFSDCDGPLALAAKQKARFRQWIRPEEYIDEPKIIDRIDSGTIKQTIVSDCSFIASLAIAARYERRFGKRLVTSRLYPQNKRGEPVYNPCGKYMVKLHLNGVYRKVIIDDRLPIGQHGDLLCSYSQNKSELWVSLLEKAYMKVMGGYDFPGSNSNIDLHALTGWIPERIAIRLDSADFNKDATFEKMLERFHRGDCLVTVATGKLSQADQDRAGLVECHAYAMLDVRQVHGKRLFLLKNPWTHLRWKGRYSERDAASWTAQLCKAVDYNPLDAQQFDDGVFWIDYDSVCHFFDVFYVNWNPSLFSHSYGIHS